MKENNMIRLSVCPRCGRSFCEPPALSRLDNETLICPDCGTREALDSIGVKPDEQEQILAAIHRRRAGINPVRYTVSRLEDCVVYISEMTGYIRRVTVIYTHNKTNGGTRLCGKKAASELTVRFFTTG